MIKFVGCHIRLYCKQLLYSYLNECELKLVGMCSAMLNFQHGTVLKQKLMLMHMYLHTVSYLYLLMWKDKWVCSQGKVVEIFQEKSSRHWWGCSEGNDLLTHKVT